MTSGGRIAGAAPVLEVDGVSKSFGGLRAISDCSFTVSSGQIFGVIGPNGSGKSTLFNIICGLLRPDAGDVRFDGSSVVGRSPHRLAHRGIARLFQVPRVFAGLTLEQNVRVVTSLFRRGAAQAPEPYLAEFGLAALAGVYAKDVSHGQQKLLEFAMVSAMAPSLLLLDEPTAGVNPQFIAHMQELIRRIRDRGVAILVVEHTLRVVDALCDRVMVVDQGRVVAQGSPDQLKSMPDVRKSYYLL